METDEIETLVNKADSDPDAQEACATYLKAIAETQLIIIKELNYLSAYRKGD